MSLKNPLILLSIMCCAIVCLTFYAHEAQAASSSAVWELTQADFDGNHAVPDDSAWIPYKILRSGDTSGTVSLRYAVTESTIGFGNGPGMYELLGPDPIVFGPGETYAVIRIRYHKANHDLFGTQHLTLSLSSEDVTIESGHESRTLFVDYPATPIIAFVSPPPGGFSAVEGQSMPVVINITKDGDTYTDSYVDIFASGTASNGLDYTVTDASGQPVGIPGTIHLPPGQAIYSLYMIPLDDGTNDGNETATFNLGNAIKGDIGSKTSAILTIYEKGTATLVSPTGQPISTPLASPAATPAATAGMPSGNTTPVPLPAPGLSPVINITIFACVATYLLLKKKS